MTLQQLNDHYDLLLRRRRAIEVRDALLCAACPGAQRLTGMPHSSGSSDMVGGLAIEIAEIDANLQRIEEQIKAGEKAIEEWLSGIDDTRVKIILRLRYVRGFQWKEIAGTVGHYQTDGSIRNIAYRYLKENGVAW